jgi:hypothetical protein
MGVKVEGHAATKIAYSSSSLAHRQRAGGVAGRLFSLAISGFSKRPFQINWLHNKHNAQEDSVIPTPSATGTADVSPAARRSKNLLYITPATESANCGCGPMPGSSNTLMLTAEVSLDVSKQARSGSRLAVQVTHSGPIVTDSAVSSAGNLSPIRLLSI